MTRAALILSTPTERLRAARKPYQRVAVDKRVKHGHGSAGESLTYSSWYNMRTRCENPRATQYALYGGRGIAVCARWADFTNFLADMGERPSAGHTLDRYPNKDGNYEPGNCRWATQSEQCRNKRTSRPVERSDGARYPSMAHAADAVGGSHKGIWDACNGKAKTHRGFGWSYA